MILAIVAVVLIAAGARIARPTLRRRLGHGWRVLHLGLVSASVIAFVTGLAVQLTGASMLAWLGPALIGVPMAVWLGPVLVGVPMAVWLGPVLVGVPMAAWLGPVLVGVPMAVRRIGRERHRIRRQAAANSPRALVGAVGAGGQPGH